jgi:hypothetical protein
MRKARSYLCNYWEYMFGGVSDSSVPLTAKHDPDTTAATCRCSKGNTTKYLLRFQQPLSFFPTHKLEDASFTFEVVIYIA